MDSIILDYIGQDKQDFQENRISRKFFCLHRLPPAIASSSGEADGDEIDETQSTFGGKKKLTLLFIYLISAPENCGH